MIDYGMICEWNPLHRGHARLIRQARQRGADRIVCVMSGNTVQRGELAVADRYLRAEAAIRCGVDLVLELPFPWCSGSAESFARGGISILRHFADHLIFGSECGDLTRLSRAAEESGTEGFRQEYREALERGEPAAAAYAALLGKRGIPSLSSNDLLGVEYIRWSRTLAENLQIETVQRTGAAYGDREIPEGALPSATAIRHLWEQGRFREAEQYLPPECAEVYARGRSEGRMIRTPNLDAVLLSHFRMKNEEELSEILGCEGGLGNRICRLARETTSTEELLTALKNKRYTDAKLRRTLLYGLFGVKKEDMESLPSYTTVLGASERGRALLRERSRTLPEEFFVITKPADAPAKARQTQLAIGVDRVYTLCTERRTPASVLMKKGPFLL